VHLVEVELVEMFEVMEQSKSPAPALEIEVFLVIQAF
jgi:hypothetical protein